MPAGWPLGSSPRCWCWCARAGQRLSVAALPDIPLSLPALQCIGLGWGGRGTVGGWPRHLRTVGTGHLVRCDADGSGSFGGRRAGRRRRRSAAAIESSERDHWRRSNRPVDCAPYKRTVQPFGPTRVVRHTLRFGHASAGHTATRCQTRISAALRRPRPRRVGAKRCYARRFRNTRALRSASPFACIRPLFGST